MAEFTGYQNQICTEQIYVNWTGLHIQFLKVTKKSEESFF